MKSRIKAFVSTNPIEVAIGICLVIAALTVGNYVGSWGKQTEIDEYKEQVEQFEQRVQTVTEFSELLQEQQIELTDSITQLETQKIQAQQSADRFRSANTRLTQRLDSLRSTIGDINLDSIPEPVVQYINVLEIQIDTLQAEVTALRGALNVSNSQILVWESKFDLEQQRADSLQVVINTFPTNVPDPDRLFGIIKLPSRTSSFLVGGALGVIGGITFASNF
jgi:chaperonin cofactor prefoldin